MISPCNCKGSMQNVHFSCLQKWLETRIKDLHGKRVIDLDDMRCDICKGKFAKNYQMPINSAAKTVSLIDPFKIGFFKNKYLVHFQALTIEEE